MDRSDVVLASVGASPATAETSRSEDVGNTRPSTAVVAPPNAEAATIETTARDATPERVARTSFVRTVASGLQIEHGPRGQMSSGLTEDE